MWLVFVFLLLIITGFIFSSVDMLITKIKASIKGFDCDVKISLYWFGILKVLSIKLDKYGINIFGKKIKYNNLKKDMKVLYFEDIVKIIKEFKFKMSNVDFTLKIGAENVFLTSILVVIASTVIARKFQKTKCNKRKIKYRVFPDFNRILIFFEGKLILKFNTREILMILYKNILSKKILNKTSKKYVSIEN